MCALFAEKVCLGCLESTAFTRDSCVEARIQWFQWEISNLTNADCAADLVFHKLLLGLGVCQPIKVRRQLLWNIETEHKGKAMITMVITEMMMMMMMMVVMACLYPQKPAKNHGHYGVRESKPLTKTTSAVLAFAGRHGFKAHFSDRKSCYKGT